ncbi:hypothetical protein CJ179_11335 [Rhodococcus sp. ACS1]|jgi:predicted metal-dependent phosphoesterase TrpH|uniref:hypothetical protein n=1 Tax=Rhodococcus TaxID=1827 RepID=UPI000BB15549|nr:MULTISPECIES: hypothetical protein [Rhodococcus]PBC49894.1 hypothetical protein CJ179_11335 [Rhodococcus sp. ACS1]QSE80877.1 hypothetical protein JWS14_17845 [Rhodococcus koreensis]
MTATRKPGLASNPLERREQARAGAHPDGTYSRTRRKELLVGVTREPGLVSNPLERRKRRLPNLVEQCVDVAQVGALGEEKMTAKRAPAGKKQVSVSIETARVEHGKDAVAAIGHIAGAPQSWSDLVDEALTHYLAVLERRYNNCEPFPPRNAETVRRPRR